jgi:type I restriction enzyme S subunit
MPNNRVIFGDVVRDVKINIDRNNNPYEHYIAGDHMDTDSIRIVRRGNFNESPEPGPAFTRLFMPGQVLYGSRRTYLRKVAVPNFAGICANTTFVLETKDENVLTQKILPFIMYSESFTNFSINNSRGSTNPYILFSDIAKYEFKLPPINKQREVAVLLCQVNYLRESYRDLLSGIDAVVKSQFVEMLGDPVSNPLGWERGTIRDIVTEVKYGTSKPAVDGGQYPYLRMNNITYYGQLDLTDLKFIDMSSSELEKCIVHKGDVLFNRTNSKELVGKTCVFDLDEPMVIAGYIIRMRLNEKVIPVYLSAVLNSDYGKQLLRTMCKKVIGQANINAQELQDIELLIPPINRQIRFADFVQATDKYKVG